MMHLINDMSNESAPRGWIAKRFAESYSSVVVLMVHSLPHLACLYAYALEERHMQVARKLPKIGDTSGRPQRILTSLEYIVLAESYDRDFDAPDRRYGINLVLRRASKALLDRIIKRGRAKASTPITAVCAA